MAGYQAPVDDRRVVACSPTTSLHIHKAVIENKKPL
jgi:hypothetical protein